MQEILEQLKPTTPEIDSKVIHSDEQYELGLARFKAAKRGEKMIRHRDRDVVGYVVRGRGTLRTLKETIEVVGGSICLIPAGTEHDFSCSEEELVLLYLTIRKGTIGIPSHT